MPVQSRAFLVRMRKTVNPPRRLMAELVDADKALVRYTCTTCGHTFTDTLVFRTGQLMSPPVVKHMIRYWGKTNGATGHCARCTRKARDQLYPLPKSS